MDFKEHKELSDLITNAITNAIDGVYNAEFPILKQVDAINISNAIHDEIYIELKKDLERIALILEEILKQFKRINLNPMILNKPKPQSEMSNYLKQMNESNRLKQIIKKQVSKK